MTSASPVLSTFKPCGGVGRMCRCHDTIADCSRNRDYDRLPRLTFIPVFHRHITSLDLSYNGYKSIPTDDFFLNVTGISDLDLSSNDLSYVSPGAFKVFRHLKSLNLEFHKLNYSQLELVLAIPFLEKLNLFTARLPPLPDDLFYRNPASHLTTLNVIFSQMESLNMSAFRPLKRLKHLNTGADTLSNVISDHLPVLENLVLGNEIRDFPVTCDEDGQSFYPNLLSLDLFSNRISFQGLSSSQHQYCLPRLKTLDLGSMFTLKEINLTEFESLRNLKVLNLSSSRLGTIHPGYLPSLEKLDLYGTDVREFPPTCTSEGQSMFPRLSFLDLSNSRISNLTSSYGLSPTPTPCLPQLTTLLLDENCLDENRCDPALETLDMTALRSLQRLRVLSAVDAHISFIKSDYMPSLRTLRVNSNGIKRFPFTCSKNDSLSLFPSLTELDLSSNNIGEIYWRSGESNHTCQTSLPQLRNLTLQSNTLSANGLQEDAFSDVWLPQLQFLDLKSVGFKVKLPDISNSRLRTLDLSLNGLDFAEHQSRDVFIGCTSLTVLNLAGNSFLGITPSKLKHLLAPLQSLRVLYLNTSEVETIRSGVFRSLENIVEIYLQDNRLSVIPNGAFDGLEDLRTLRLDGNSIWTISEDAFSLATRGRLLSFNLTRNPLQCTCSLLWFHRWVVYDPNVFDRHNFSCFNIPGTSLRAFFLNEQKCLLSHNASVLIITFVAVFIAGLAFVTTFYRYRWLVRLVVYEAFRRDPEARWRQRRPEDFQYDLFVSYSSEDSRWVHEHLVPVLEQDMGIRLCLHQRDFDPRKPVMKNIMDCLEVSKRVLVLLSPSFAEDKECNFQLEMCLTHMVEGDDVMVIVILEEVPPRDMSGAMRALMKTTTYIEWNDDPEAIASFWRRMTLALVDILPGVNH